jgi:uncharacterized DUF497 family protein
MSVTFEWDGEKALENVKKHGVDFEEASSAFFDPLSLTILDPEHSMAEERSVLLGLSAKQRLIVVVHIDRGDRIRLISAREASRPERRSYEGG